MVTGRAGHRESSRYRCSIDRNRYGGSGHHITALASAYGECVCTRCCDGGCLQVQAAVVEDVPASVAERAAQAGAETAFAGPEATLQLMETVPENPPTGSG